MRIFFKSAVQFSGIKTFTVSATLLPKWNFPELVQKNVSYARVAEPKRFGFMVSIRQTNNISSMITGAADLFLNVCRRSSSTIMT
jgi:hypothetical protein